jgi:hypothetical protein
MLVSRLRGGRGNGREPLGNRYERWQAFRARRQQEVAEAVEDRKERQSDDDQFPPDHVPSHHFTKHNHASFDVGQLKEFLGNNFGAGVGVWHRLGNAHIAWGGE